MSKLVRPGQWLSFADPSKPRGEQYLGVVIVDEPNMMGAIAKAGRLGINPGGEVVGYPIDLDDYNEDDLNRLFTKAEAEKLGEKVVRTRDGMKLA